MTKYNIGCCFFTKNNFYYGLLSDGDIRRFLSKNDKIKNDIPINIINKNGKMIHSLDKRIFEYKEVLKYRFIPIVIENKIIGIIDCQKYLFN